MPPTHVAAMTTSKPPRDVVDAMVEVRRIVDDVTSRDMPSGARAALGLVEQAASIAWRFGLGPRIIGLRAEKAAIELRRLCEEFGQGEDEVVVEDEDEVEVETVEIRAHNVVANTGVRLGFTERVAMARLVLAGIATVNDRHAVVVGVQHQRFAVIDLLEQFAAAESPLAHDRLCDLIEATVGLRPPRDALDSVLRGISGGKKWDSIFTFIRKLGIETPVDVESLRVTYTRMKTALHLDP